MNKAGSRLRSPKDVNMLEGPILPAVVVFMLPLVLSTLLQVLYSAADIVVLGRFASVSAQASVGATSAINSLIVSWSVAISVGSKIILARALGAKDHKRAERVVHTSVLFGLLLGLLFLVVGEALTYPLLHMTKCPAETIDGAALYLQITMLGCPATFSYNTLAALLRTKGDTKRPLYYLIFSGLLNVLLNLWFVAGLGMGVAGVAIATVASNYLSAILVFVRLLRLPADDPCRVRFGRIRMNFAEVRRIVRLGLPTTISSLMYPISNLQIQSAINAFGDAAIAGNSAAGSVEGIISSVTGAISVAAVAFIGQNIGAGNRDRVKRIWKSMLVFGVLLTLSIELPMLFFGRQILSIYVDGPLAAAAIDFGYIRIVYNLLAYFVPAIMNLNSGTIQSFGYTTFSMFSSLIGVCGFRVLWMIAVYPHYKTPEVLYLCYPISWTLVAIVGTVFSVYLIRNFSRGKSYKL